MNRNIPISFLIIVMLTAAGCASTQTSSSTGDNLDDATITTKVKAQTFNDANVSARKTGEIIVKVPVDKGEAPEMDLGNIVITRQVYRGDLDLGNVEGVKILEERIETAAREACRELITSEQKFPIRTSGPPSMRGCIDNAIHSADEQKQLAISMAG